MRDIGFREALTFAPLVALTIIIGVAPKPVLDMSSASVTQLLAGYDKAVAPIKRAEAAKKELTLTQNVEKGSVAR
jgi:NADH-quinone oxidoreductase subunit M